MTRPASTIYWFDFDPRFRLLGLAFGVTPRTAWVQLTDTELVARFGWWRVRTELTNIAEASVTGPYHLIKTAGPARLSISDRGITFATNARAGVCLRFHRPVRGIDARGLIRHPNLTLTVADPHGLAQTLTHAANGRS